MNPATSFIKRHPLIAFWTITYVVTYVGFLLYFMYPNPLWQFVLLLITVGAAIVAAIADGRTGLKTYLGRIVHWRVGLQWYLFALLFPLMMRLAAFGLTRLSGAQPAAMAWPTWGDFAFLFVFTTFSVSLGEDPGIRGLSLHYLMKGRSALVASLILGVLHIFWHLPLMIEGGPVLLSIPVILAGAVINTWIFNRTNQSILIIMLIHTSIDVTAEYFSPLFNGSAAITQALWLMTLYVVTAVILPVLAGKELGRRTEPVLPPVEMKQPVFGK